MWFYLALAFAVISSFSVLVAKKVMREVDQYTYLLLVSIFTAPYLLIFSLVFFDLPKLDNSFWLATITGTVISVVASIFVYRAIKESELSLVNPISAFNPIFTTIIAFFFLGEVLQPKDILGVVIVVIGTYILQLSKTQKGFLEPLKGLVNHKGVQLAFIGYVLWGITPSFEKTGILHTFPQNPIFPAFVGKMIAILIFLVVVLRKPKTDARIIASNLKWILLDGIFGGVGIAIAFIAYSLSPLGITTAVFKLSVVFVPILAGIFLKERNIKERLLGSIVMLVGVVILLI